MCIVRFIQRKMRGGGFVLTLGVVLGISVFGLSGCQPDVHSVSISLEEFRVTPHHIVISGLKPLRLFITNRGREPHLFESSLLMNHNTQVVWDGAKHSTPFLGQELWLNPNDTAILIIEAPIGYYWFRCSLRGHKGMNGSIEIVG